MRGGVAMPGCVAALALAIAAAHAPSNVGARVRCQKLGIISGMLPRLTKIIALTLALGACSLFTPKFERPTVTVIGIEMRGGNLLQQKFAVKLNIQNPNDRALPVHGLQEQ